MQEAQARPFKQTSPWVFPDVWVIFKILSIHTRSYITIPFQFSFFFFFFFCGSLQVRVQQLFLLIIPKSFFNLHFY